MISKEDIDREERYISDGTNKTDRNELICFLSQYSIFLIFFNKHLLHFIPHNKRN